MATVRQEVGRMGKTLSRRVDDLERASGPAPDKRFVVVFPGDPEPDVGDDPNAIIFRIVYDDPPEEVRDADAT